MKRIDLLRSIARAARRAGMQWLLVRQGGDHEVWDLDGIRVTIPRHRDVNERTALRIRELLEDRLGDRWWQR